MVLTERTVEAAVRAALHSAAHCDAFELRVDCLDAAEEENASAVPALLAAQGVQHPVILTIRRRGDGGFYHRGEDRRAGLYHQAVTGAVKAGAAFWAIDLEEDFDPDGLAAEARSSGVSVIRSIHDVRAVPKDLGPRVDAMARTDDEIVKAAVMVNSSADLLTVCRFSAGLGNRRRIILGMGDWGFPSRILAGKLGSMLTFCSTPGRSAAPGHVDVDTLDSLYRYREITADTPVFGVIGNPIGHSRSPEYHNKRFAEDGVDAVYVPFRVDDVSAFFELARFLGIRGVSVTIPHKQAVIPQLRREDETVTAIGACNTITRIPQSDDAVAYQGTNTDVVGFLRPLLSALGREDLAGLNATVVGAGGAARGVVYGLLVSGASVCVVNRTAARSAVLLDALSGYVRPGAHIVTADLGHDGAAAAGAHADIIVQATSVGMHPDEGQDPFPEYEFTGKEVVCDIIYTPERTAFLERAAAAGCTVVPGTAMFQEQASEQYRLFKAQALA